MYNAKYFYYTIHTFIYIIPAFILLVLLFCLVFIFSYKYFALHINLCIYIISAISQNLLLHFSITGVLCRNSTGEKKVREIFSGFERRVFGIKKDSHK